jgi:hypothetical protein
MYNEREAEISRKGKTHVMQNFADWVWMLAIFPLWAITASLWFGLASAPKRSAGPEMRRIIDGAAVVLSMCSAIGILVELNCESFITLPFADPACRMPAFQLSALIGL